MKRLAILGLLFLGHLAAVGVAGEQKELAVTPGDGRFFGGEQVSRSIVCADVGEETVCRWALVLPDEQVVEEGTLTLARAAGEARGEFVTHMPPVTQRLNFYLVVQLRARGTFVEERRYWETVFPAGPGAEDLEQLRGLRMGLLDPAGTTAPVLAQMKVPFSELSANMGLGAFSGDVIIVGEDALTEAPATLLLAEERARRGVTVVVLAQKTWPPTHLWPLWFLGVRGPETSYASALSTRAELGRDLLRDDLNNWRRSPAPGEPEGTQLATWKALRVPEWGNRRLHLGSRGAASATEAFLFEYRVGDGRVFLTTMPMVTCYEREPVARVLLRNVLLLAAADRKAEWKRLALWGDPKGRLVSWLRELGLEAPLNPVNLAEMDVIVVEGGASLATFFPRHEKEQAEELVRFTGRGGTVFLIGLKAEVLPEYEGLLPKGTTLTETKVEQVLFERKEPLLWGIPPDAFGRFVANWEAVVLPEFPGEAKAEALTKPPLLVRLPAGKGAVLLVQAPFGEPEREGRPTEEQAKCLLSQILTNLGVRLSEPAGGGKEESR
jgi:hypothetical protein